MTSKRIWITTDTHFGHHAIINSFGRPENFEDIIITQWKKVVLPTDTIIHLGDVTFGNKTFLSSIMSQLPGKKVLIKGNHDYKHSDVWFLDAGFDFVCTSFISDKILYTHIPVQTLPEGCNYNICGHVHNLPIETILFYDKIEFKPWHIVLSLEHMKYSPRLLGDVLGRFGQKNCWDRRDVHGEVELKPIVPPLTFSITEERYKDHIRYGGSTCPKCNDELGCRIYTNQTHNGYVECLELCLNCEFEFLARYKLDSFEIVNSGGKPIERILIKDEGINFQPFSDPDKSIRIK